MSGLVPEQRTNVNGVTQRKWVRPQQASSPGAASIPSPAMAFAAAPEPGDEDLHERARAALHRITADLHWVEEDGQDEDEGEQSFRSKIEEILPQLDGPAAWAFADACEEYVSHTATHLIADAVLALLYDPRLPDDTKNTAVRNYLSLVTPLAPEGEDEDNGIYLPLFALTALDTLDRDEVAAPFSPEQVEGYRQAVRAVNGVADRHRNDSVCPGLARNENGYFAPTGPETLRVLREHHEKAGQIAEALIERASFDAATARGIAEGGALGTGHL